MRLFSWRNLAAPALVILLSANSHAAKDVALIKVDDMGCPTGVVPETEACPSVDKQTGRICRNKRSRANDVNANKVSWEYYGKASRDQFTIQFKDESPFSNCDTAFDSNGGQPKSPKCKISESAVEGRDYAYSVIVENHENCPLDPKIYILH